MNSSLRELKPGGKANVLNAKNDDSPPPWIY